MPRSLAKFSESEASNHTPFLAGFTTTMLELKFSVHTGHETALKGRTHDCKRSLLITKKLLQVGGHPHMRRPYQFSGSLPEAFSLIASAQRSTRSRKLRRFIGSGSILSRAIRRLISAFSIV